MSGRPIKRTLRDRGLPHERPVTDAPICQDTPSGGLDDLLTSAEVGHDALVNLSREEAFQAADDVAFGPASGDASGDVVAGRLVELRCFRNQLLLFRSYLVLTKQLIHDVQC